MHLPLKLHDLVMCRRHLDTCSLSISTCCRQLVPQEPKLGFRDLGPCPPLRHVLAGVVNKHAELGELLGKRL